MGVDQADLAGGDGLIKSEAVKLKLLKLVAAHGRHWCYIGQKMGLHRRTRMGVWSPGEDLLLLRAVAEQGQKWTIIQDKGLVPGRSARQMCMRFKEVLNPDLEKQPMRPEAAFGSVSWNSLVRSDFRNRTAGQLRAAWGLYQQTQAPPVDLRFPLPAAQDPDRDEMLAGFMTWAEAELAILTTRQQELEELLQRHRQQAAPDSSRAPGTRHPLRRLPEIISNLQSAAMLLGMASCFLRLFPTPQLYGLYLQWLQLMKEKPPVAPHSWQELRVAAKRLHPSVTMTGVKWMQGVVPPAQALRQAAQTFSSIHGFDAGIRGMKVIVAGSSKQSMYTVLPERLDEPTPGFDSIASALEDLAAGKFVVVLDDEDRENEGDLIINADKVTTEAMAFMVEHTSGVICISMEGRDLDRLKLPLMVQSAENDESMYTAFTITLDLRVGTTTGISAADRAATLRAMADPERNPDDFRRPGHIFPLRYRQGGVIVRPGHTEAAVDLARASGSYPAGVLCEIVDRSDGSMARTPKLMQFAKQHGLKIVTIADLIRGIQGSQRHPEVNAGGM
eukprot:gene9154-9322_t